MFCGSCGRALDGQPYCAGCGTPANDASTTPARRHGAPLLIGGLAGAVVIALALVAWIALSGSQSSSSARTTSAKPVTVTSAASPSAQSPSVTPSSTPTPTAASGPGDVRTLPAGLFCRDLDAKGFSYTAAVEYWRLHGQPNQMDAERNGIPCETVYPSSDVTAYWGPRPSVDYAYDAGFDSLPAGLFCRDLVARGLDYSDAVAYWGYWGQPDRMDEDLNGIPCETVYSPYDVQSYWG